MTAINAHAGSPNLIENGDFEDVGSVPASLGPNIWLFTTGSELENWTDASSNSPAFYAEVRDDAAGIGLANTGSKFLELDTHTTQTNSVSNGGIAQVVSGLTAGDKYNLSFFYSPRINTSGFTTDTANFEVYWNSDLVTTIIPGITSSNSHNWQGFNTELTSITGDNTLAFVAAGTEDVFGASIDTVSLTAVAAVPEPETYAMFLAGLGLLAFASRKRQA